MIERIDKHVLTAWIVIYLGGFVVLMILGVDREWPYDAWGLGWLAVGMISGGIWRDRQWKMWKRQSIGRRIVSDLKAALYPERTPDKTD